MKACAVITAAGMSSRMGAFKPMLKIGEESAAKLVLSALRKGGAEEIAVVTGNKADALEKHLEHSGVIFLRNDSYKETDMLCSVKIGLRYFGKREKVLFTPVDVPLFSANTVKRLLASEKGVAIPVCNEKTGHPVLLCSEAIGAVLSYEGCEGLRGALAAYGGVIDYIEVDDEGILFDMDTREDYEKLVRRCGNVNRL